MGGLTPEQEVLEKSARRCCLCFGLNGDLTVKKGQIAHLDHNHQNNKVINLAFLCLAHHDEYDTRTSQSKSWTIQEVKHYRKALYTEIENLRGRNRNLTTDIYQYTPPIFGKIFARSNQILGAVDKSNGQRH